MSAIALVLVASAGTGRAAVATPVSGSGASPISATLPGMPASVRGLSDDASVSVFSGQITYSVPLELPAAQGGFGPRLSLVYAGELGNGPLGVGWRLSSVAIVRSLRHGVPRYDDTDELELVGLGSGGRLIPDPSSEGRFWLEGHGKAFRIERRGQGFEVTDSSGTRHYLGLTSQATLGTGQQTAGWFLERSLDVTRKKSAEFTYVRRFGQLYLDRIEWGPVGSRPIFRVVVARETRPDVVTSWATGFEVRTDQRITSIATEYLDGTRGEYRVRRRHNVRYDDRLPLSRVASVEERGVDGNGALPKLTFQYGGLTPAAVTEARGTSGWALNERSTTLLDVDGDGMADLVRLELGNHEWKRNRGGVFEAAKDLPGAEDVDLHAARLIDLDGDSRPELVRIVDDTWRAYRLVRQGGDLRWARIGVWDGTEGVPLHGPDVVLADLDGNGITDVVRGETAGLRIWFGTRSGLRPAQRRPPINALAADLEPGDDAVRFGDVNGDGLADVTWLTDGWLRVFLGRGDGTFVPWSRSEYPWGTSPVATEDVHLADLNRDGLIDLIRFSAAHALWYPGRADGGFDASAGRKIPRPQSAAADSAVALGDVNGNGSDELLWSSGGGMWLLDFAGPATAGMLTTIENGLGKSIEFSYLTTATISTQAAGFGAPWADLVPAAIPVPVSAEVLIADESGDRSRAERRLTKFSVRDGVWDGQERRFAGFAAGTQTAVAADASSTLVTDTEFHVGLGADRALRGMPWHSVQLDGTGRRLTEQTREWETFVPRGFPTDRPELRVAALKSISARNFDSSGSAVETKSAFEYDEEGRMTIERHFGRLDVQDDQRLLRRFYAENDEVTWIRDLVCEEHLEQMTPAGQAGALVSKARTCYTDAKNSDLGCSDVTRAQPSCSPGIGRLRRTEGWLASESRWVESAFSIYDELGNPESLRRDGIARRFKYDPDRFYIEEEDIEVGPSKSLSWRVEWDRSHGLPRAITEPTGVTTISDLDSLGRLTSVRISGHHPHLHTRYEWDSPRPRTVSYVFDGPVEEIRTDAPSGAGWRQSVGVFNGAGESQFVATRLDEGQWIVGGWSERDERGRVRLTAEAFYSPALPALRPAGVAYQSIAHDALGRPLRIQLPSGAERTFTYGAFSRTVSSSGTSPVTSFLDGLGRVRRTERTVDGQLEVGDVDFDPADRPIAIRLQGGAVETSYSYDSLGRLIGSSDPDIGSRSFTYYDEGRLKTATNGTGQVVALSYDGMGRLMSRSDGTTSYTYRYDEPFIRQANVGLDVPAEVECASDASRAHLAGRLSYVLESGGDGKPRGLVCFRYDNFGRRNYSERLIAKDLARSTLSDSVRGWVQTTYAASGLPLRQRYGDGFELRNAYDGAGRLTSVSRAVSSDRFEAIWSASIDGAGRARLDASGRILEESLGNGLRSVFNRSTGGLIERVRVGRGPFEYALPSSATDAGSETPPLLHISIQHNAYGAPTRVTDLDGIGQDHSATYSYDGAARLVAASQGGPTSRFQFRYQYDALQNMTARLLDGPWQVPGLEGIYRYGSGGGSGGGPRQLVAIEDPRSRTLCGDGEVQRTFQFDAAGRMVAGQRANLNVNWSAAFDGFDQLLSVDSAGRSIGRYSYGFDGLRTIATDAQGESTYWFSAGWVLRGGKVEHAVSVADRVVARVVGAADSLAGGGFVQPPKVAGLTTIDALALLFVLLVGVGLLGAALFGAPRRRRVPALPAGIAMAALFAAPLLANCTDAIERERQGWTTASVVYMHQAVAAGPVLFTNSAGTVLDERRYEPFGVALDSTAAPRTVDYEVDPQNVLNQETDPETTLSYHGARWMDPSIARWLSPDAPTKVPDGGLLAEPWSMNPYQYGSQSPTLFWDADGNFVFLPFLIAVGIGAALGATVSAAVFAVVTLSSGNFSWSGLGKAALFGGVSGAVSGGFFGALGAAGVSLTSLSAGELALTSGLASAGGEIAAEGLVEGHGPTLSRVGEAFLWGAAFGYGQHAVSSRYPAPAAPSVPRSNSNASARAGSPATENPPTRLTPADFGAQTIAENPKLLKLWQQAKKEVSAPGRDNAYTRYLEKIGQQTLSNKELREAFDVVRSRFMNLVKSDAEASSMGIIEVVHHWNFPLQNFSEQVVDPRILVPTTKANHLLIHRLTSSNPANPHVGPVAPQHMIELHDFSDPLPPWQ